MNHPTPPSPAHIAIIMDGNGRWARQQGMPRIEGHRAGAEAVNRIVRMCREIGIGYLTLYAFSEQNWQRPTSEVNGLMGLLLDYVRGQRREILDNNIRLTTIGETKRLPAFVRLPLYELMRASSKNTGMVLTLALSYGGREEIARAARAVAQQVAAGTLKADEIDEGTLARQLYTADTPDPDLIIRTSGEERLSNFLLWQAAYAELYFSPVPWPEFDRAHLQEALEVFNGRQRRFGLTGEQVQVKRTAKC
ncbi:MAG: isoprenyl transferase [Bradymonadia bacterium]